MKRVLFVVERVKSIEKSMVIVVKGVVIVAKRAVI